ncbi:UNVERIFIED_CONTAM: Serine/threonine-protein phosphatase 7 long form [Sesamum calycinum]|uniref:Serine/threonine-protein phosphatase 7 long form n=1 Tax=Sesamum calycinum TaxID=2727403 RepID=A0AAW2N5C6_9LAMI
MANFGPIDTSVLYGQANHRSEDVLGDPDTTLTVRRGDISFFRVLQLVPRHIRVLQVLQNMGFLGILQCGHIEIDTHLITALVERWRPETHTFHFSVGEATVTLQDISIIWALPIEGNLITGVDIKWTTQQWQNYCHQWLGFRPNENAFKHSRIKLSALLDWLLNNTCDDESPFDAVLQEARVCVMCIIGGILCPDATGNTVSLLYLRHMEIIDEERPSNWVITNMGMVTHNNTCPIPSNNAADLMPTVILKTSYPFLHMLHDITGYRPTDTRDWEYVYNRMEQLVLDCDNSGDDIQSLRETRARNRAIGRDIMTFSSARYPSVRAVPQVMRLVHQMSTCGPSNVYNEAGPSNVYNEAGPSNFFTPTGPSYAYTSNMPFSSGDLHITSIQRHEDILGFTSAIDGSDLNTPIEEPQDIHPRRNRRRPRCGTGGHY